MLYYYRQETMMTIIIDALYTHRTGSRLPILGLVRNQAGPVRRSESSRRHRSG